MFGTKNEADTASHDSSGEQSINREHVASTLSMADAAEIDPAIRRVAQ